MGTFKRKLPKGQPSRTFSTKRYFNWSDITHFRLELQAKMCSNVWLLSALLLSLCIVSGHTRSVINHGEDSNQENYNDRPIIGVLSQEMLDKEALLFPDKHSYIPASYLKYIEGAGARGVPILIDQSDEYYVKMFNSINGLLLPGGAVDLVDSGYARAGAKFYQLAIAANDDGDHFPIWGTCLGFELLSVLTAGSNYLTNCDSFTPRSLTFQTAAKSSRLFGNAPEDVLDTLANSASTANIHEMCLTEANFTNSRLSEFYDITTTSIDDAGLTFISSVEAKNYPFWGVQFHPEKVLYEWLKPTIPHSAGAVDASQYFADFFINQARKSGHSFVSSVEEDQYLIYNYSPTFLRNISNSFEQSYYFD